MADTTVDVQSCMARLKMLAGAGADNLVIAGIGFGDGHKAKQTYAPNGHYAESLDKVTPIFTEIITKIMDDV